jgi:hypothetical protein
MQRARSFVRAVRALTHRPAPTLRARCAGIGPAIAYLFNEVGRIAPNVLFKTGHNLSRYTSDGLTRSEIANLQCVVRAEIQPIARSVESGATFGGRTAFRGKTYEYRAISMEGNIEINTLFRVK